MGRGREEAEDPLYRQRVADHRRRRRSRGQRAGRRPHRRALALRRPDVPDAVRGSAVYAPGHRRQQIAVVQSRGDRLSHLDESGAAHMVDVTGKDATRRTAVAAGTLRTRADVVELIATGGLPKGDALATARVAGILAAKHTSDLIPLCHQLALTGVDVDFTVGDSDIEIIATVHSTDRTGVEMEALTAVSVAALTLYDMIKAVDRAARIDDIRVLRKDGGRSGSWARP